MGLFNDDVTQYMINNLMSKRERMVAERDSLKIKAREDLTKCFPQETVSQWAETICPDELKIGLVKKLDTFEVNALEQTEIIEKIGDYCEDNKSNIIWAINRASSLVFNDLVVKGVGSGDPGSRSLKYMRLHKENDVFYVEDYCIFPKNGIHGRQITIAISPMYGDGEYHEMEFSELVNSVTYGDGYNHLKDDIFSLISECRLLIDMFSQEKPQKEIVTHSAKDIYSHHRIGICYKNECSFHMAGTHPDDYSYKVLSEFIGLISTVFYVNLYFHKSIEDRESVCVHVENMERKSQIKKQAAVSTPYKNKIVIGGKHYIYTNSQDAARSFRTRKPCDHSFSVHGHMRHYKSGKEVWISPYVKGKKYDYVGKEIKVESGKISESTE